MITNLNKYRKVYEAKNNYTDLVIVDVQETFKRFFNNTYLLELKKFAEDFQQVHQIWDDVEANEESYYFPNQVNSYRKSYGGELTVDDIKYYFYDDRIIDELKYNFDVDAFNPGDKYETLSGDYWVYIGSYHEWFLCPVELAEQFKTLEDHGRKVCLVGGANNECLHDIHITMLSFDVDVEINYEYVYSEQGAPMEEQDSDIHLDKYLREIEETNEEKNTEHTSLENSKLAELDKDKDEEGKMKVYDEIPDDMYIDKIVDIFTGVEELLESHGDHISSLDMTHRTIDRNDIVWITAYLKPRTKSAAYPLGEMGVIQCKVLRTYYGLHKLKQLKSTDKIIG